MQRSKTVDPALKRKVAQDINNYIM